MPQWSFEDEYFAAVTKRLYNAWISEQEASNAQKAIKALDAQVESMAKNFILHPVNVSFMTTSAVEYEPAKSPKDRVMDTLSTLSPEDLKDVLGQLKAMNSDELRQVINQLDKEATDALEIPDGNDDRDIQLP